MKKILMFVIGILSMVTVNVKAAAPIINSATVVDNGDIVSVNVTRTDYDIDHLEVGLNRSTAVSFKNKAEIMNAGPNVNIMVSVPNGEYYIWAVDTQRNYSNGYKINMQTSCNMTGLANITGSGTRAMCDLVDYKGNVSGFDSSSFFTCATGYYSSLVNPQIIQNNCGNLLFSKYQGIDKRYCQKVYKFECLKTPDNPAIASALSSLSISGGNLTPSFAPSTTNYSAVVNEASVTISATLKDSNARFIDDFGPRTVALNYGKNEIYIKTQGSAISTYKITITRNGGGGTALSTNNKLNSLNVSGVQLSPGFNTNTNKYSGSVANNVTSVTLNATLADNKASFVDGFGPRTVELKEGSNSIAIKVKSQSGSIRVYTVNIRREYGSAFPEVTPQQNRALLKELSFENASIDFQSDVFDYNVNVENDTLNVVPSIVPYDETDIIEIKGGNELKEGSNEMTIKVTTSDGTISNTYTIYIIRKLANEDISNNSLLKDLIVNGHKIKFDAKKKEYDITLNNGETELNITAEASSEKATVSIEGNENLTSGSEIKIRVTAESGDYTDYYLKIKGYKKKSNALLTVLVVLIIIIVMAYMILRILGYKIYFNFEGIKNAISNKIAKK